MEKFEFEPKDSYIRVATACPEVAVGDVNTNLNRIIEIVNEAQDKQVSLVVFPELSITGYTLGDIVNQNQLLNDARKAIKNLADSTTNLNIGIIVGFPLQVNNSLYNCAAVLANGAIKGIVPKQHLPTYGEFYEDRWYQTWKEANTTISVEGSDIPFGNNLLFDIAGVKTGIEICEDLWVPNPPSNRLSEGGALIIANPSASPEQVGKEEYRRQLVGQQSARLIMAYIYAGCHSSESTMDIVMSGHQIIAENGKILNERKPFGDKKLITSDIDVLHLEHDRRKHGLKNIDSFTVINTGIVRGQVELDRKIDQNPFLPVENAEKREVRLEQTLQIQAYGLAERMRNTKQEKIVLGLSGGLDSALALLVAYRSATILAKNPEEMIRAIVMPGPASSQASQHDAILLAETLGVPHEIIPINEIVATELALIGHDGLTQDITYENVQARARTNILFNYGNLHKCMVLGTGDLSEIAAGWCTFNADHMSHYNVNASVPKTVVKALVRHIADKMDPQVKDVMQSIINRTVSPELVSSNSGEMQSTDSYIGPIELRDFFLGHVTRYGDTPGKISYLAEQAFKDVYDRPKIHKWLSIYLDRFYANQWKRSVMPDGPKTGSIALSPRGDWRAPSDMPYVK